jgi:small subunit ribosomal protein S17
MKIFKGKIVAMKMAKTITVEVERILAHPIYKKRFKRSKKYQVHSEVEHKIGDTVNFVECPPISKLKRWKEIKSKKGSK